MALTVMPKTVSTTTTTNKEDNSSTKGVNFVEDSKGSQTSSNTTSASAVTSQSVAKSESASQTNSQASESQENKSMSTSVSASQASSETSKTDKAQERVLMSASASQKSSQTANSQNETSMSTSASASQALKIDENKNENSSVNQTQNLFNETQNKSNVKDSSVSEVKEDEIKESTPVVSSDNVKPSSNYSNNTEKDFTTDESVKDTLDMSGTAASTASKGVVANINTGINDDESKNDDDDNNLSKSQFDPNSVIDSDKKAALDKLANDGSIDREDAKNLPMNFMMNDANGDTKFAQKTVDGGLQLVATNFAAKPNSSDDGKGETIQGTLHGTGQEIYLPGNNNVYSEHMWGTLGDDTADAFCLQPLAKGPLEISKSKDCTFKAADVTKELSDPKYNELLGVLYYGYEGPKAIEGKTDENYLYTHIAASVAAWDTNAFGLRDYESQSNVEGHLTQEQIDAWRKIPQVQKLLDAAKGFSQDTLMKDGYTYTAYNAHGVDKDGKAISGSQDIFMVKWNKSNASQSTSQSLSKPDIGTTLTGTDGTHNLPVSKNGTAIDVVKYTNLNPGKKYTVKGTLVDKQTGKVVMNNGKPVTAETSFTAEKADGTVNVKFTFDNTDYVGHDIVAYEDLYDENGNKLVSHDDINDTAETDSIPTPKPEIGTTLTGEDGTHELPFSQTTTATDVVKYTGLIPGKKYTMKGTLVDKETGKVVTNNGKPVTAETSFVPEETNGTVSIKFNLDDTPYAGKALVAYEDLYDENGNKIVSHDDINDTAETDTVKTPNSDIGTTLVGSNGKHELELSKTATATDTIRYTNLIPGKEYKVVGTLIDKNTGKPVMNNGKPVTAETVFTPTSPNGTTTVTFHFDSTDYAGHELVAYEDLYDNKTGKLIVSHDDINDTAETATVTPKQPKEDTPPTPPTHQTVVVPTLERTTSPVQVVEKETPVVEKEYVNVPVQEEKQISSVTKHVEIPSQVVEKGQAQELPETNTFTDNKSIYETASIALLGLYLVLKGHKKDEDVD